MQAGARPGNRHCRGAAVAVGMGVGAGLET